MNLNEAIKIASPALGSGTMPILSCYRLHGEGDRLKVTASNINIQISAYADLPTDLDCCVDGKRLAATAAKFKEPSLVLSDMTLTVSSGRSKAKLATLDPTNYPDASNVDSGAVEAPAGMIEAIGRVAFCSGVNDVRPYLNGVLVEITPDGSNAVATDGHRMAWCSVAGGETEAAAILPIGAVSAIAGKTDRLTVGRVLVATGEGVEIVAKPIDGKYPHWRKVIRKGEKRTTFNRQAAIDALDQVRVVGDGRGLGVTLQIDEHGVTLEACTPSDSAQALIDATGVADSVSVNAAYLRDALAALQCETVELLHDGADHPIYATDGDLHVIIMPMRV